MALRIRRHRMQNGAGIAVYDNVGIPRLITGGLAGGWLDRAAVGAGVRWVARYRQNRDGRDKAEDSPAKPAPGSDTPRQHASPVLVTPDTPGQANTDARRTAVVLPRVPGKDMPMKANFGTPLAAG